jgi:peptide deformylase
VSTQAIRFFGDPVLATPSIEVVNFDKELRNLVKDLTDTMLDAGGAGLAAPQIGVSLRVFTWNIDEEIGHLINPKLQLSSEEQEGDEGCLSFPKMNADIVRAARVRCQCMNHEGVLLDFEAAGLLARALQHEVDHLNGVLFIDRMDSKNRSEVRDEVDTLQTATKKQLKRK